MATANTFILGDFERLLLLKMVQTYYISRSHLLQANENAMTISIMSTEL